MQNHEFSEVVVFHLIFVLLLFQNLMLQSLVILKLENCFEDRFSSGCQLAESEA